jgi:hypothetical protein
MICVRPLPRSGDAPAATAYFPTEASGSRRLYMSARALEFVETWVSEKIEATGYPADGEASPAKDWAAQCLAAALDEDIPATEINDAFDDLTAFIDGQIEEARDRDEGDEDDDDDFADGDEDQDGKAGQDDNDDSDDKKAG